MRLRIIIMTLALGLAACSSEPDSVAIPLPQDKPRPPETAKITEPTPLPTIEESRFDALVNTYEIKLYAAKPDMRKARAAVEGVAKQADAWNKQADDRSAVLGELMFRYRGTEQKLLVPLNKGEDRFAKLNALLPQLKDSHIEVQSFRLITLRHKVNADMVRKATAEMERSMTSPASSNAVSLFFALSRQVDAIYAQLSPRAYEGPPINRTRYTLDAAQLLFTHGHFKASKATLDQTDKGLNDLRAQHSKSSDAQGKIEGIAASAQSLRQALEEKRPSSFKVVNDDIRGWLSKHLMDE